MTTRIPTPTAAPTPPARGLLATLGSPVSAAATPVAAVDRMERAAPPSIPTSIRPADQTPRAPSAIEILRDLPSTHGIVGIGDEIRAALTSSGRERTAHIVRSALRVAFLPLYLVEDFANSMLRTCTDTVSLSVAALRNPSRSIGERILAFFMLIASLLCIPCYAALWFVTRPFHALTEAIPHAIMPPREEGVRAQ